MKNYLLFPLFLCGNMAFAQLNESFNDGNFTTDPVWSGSTSSNDFIVSNQQLRSSSTTASSSLYLSTASSLVNDCQWEFYVNLQFNPSGANYVDVYLISDQSNLQSAAVNGYYVRLGNTNDEICLFKRSGAAALATKIIDGTDGVLNSSNNKVKVRVTRTAGNVFTLERDITGLGTSYVSEGSVTDATFGNSTHFGIYVQQSTSSFHQKHFFDDFKITPLNTDNTPPALSLVSVIDSLTLELSFSEALDSVAAKSVSNYEIDKGYGNPLWIKTTADPGKYLLRLPKGLVTGSYQLSLTGIKDKAGNTITATGNSAIFSYVKPFIASKGDLVINEIFADPSPQIDLPSVEFIELFNASGQTIKLSGWKYSDASSTAILPADSIQANEYLILCAKADTNEFKPHGKTIGISPWPSLNNASDVIKLVSPENRCIDSVAYADAWHTNALKKQGGWSLERIDYQSLCQGQFNWSSSIHASGGTPGRQNSVFIAKHDQLSFKADSLKRLSDSALCIYFNKPADRSPVPNVFALNPATSLLNTLTFDTYGKQATLVYAGKFSAGTKYQLAVSSLNDCAGNTIIPTALQFETPRLPPLRVDTADIYITEILPDPSPEVKLPLAEFIEIFNPGKDTVDLDGWTLSDPTTKATINKKRISPNEYLILCPVADTLQFQPFGKTIGINPWPSLNNSSDVISLKSFSGRLADSLSYADSWHATDKKQGGWSLERIDHSSICQGTFNWTSSVDTDGGTPGKENSVSITSYDKLPFRADSIKRLTDSTLFVYFNKPTHHSANVAFTLNPASTEIKSFDLEPGRKSARLLFKSNFLPATTYSLNISSLADCAGNMINTSLQFTTPKAAVLRLDTAKIYITEIFADPSPEVKLPLVEFIEIFNPGKDTINLDGWTVSSAAGKSTIRKTKILPTSYLILCPAADTVQYKSYGKVGAVSPWPTLTNSGGQVSLKSFKERMVDSIAYADSWHNSVSKKQGGWSLERIDYQSICKGAYNWLSSIDVSGGTPGKGNSVKIESYDRLPFQADSIRQASDTTVMIYFNKFADIATAANAFNLSPLTGSIKSVHFDARLPKATLTSTNAFTANTSYHLDISGLKDCSGNLIQPNSLLTFSTPKPAPVRLDTAKLIITEIFADPSPEVKLPLAEFVEIFNPGKDTIDLEGWTLSNGKTTGKFKKVSMLPYSYVIVCSAAEETQYQVFGKTAAISPWPVLINSGDEVILKSFAGRIVDSLRYNDSWYKNIAKQIGGWTLELIDPKSRCSGSQNWLPSKAPSGGTPGKENSVHQLYKGEPLNLVSATLTDSVGVVVTFNRPADSLAMSNPKNYELNNGMGQPVSAKVSTSFQEAELTFPRPIGRGFMYHLTCSGIIDCAGTNIASGHSAEFFYPAKILKNDILISEVLFNPRSGGSDFVEIYNHSQKTLDLKELTIASVKAPDSIVNRKRVSDSSKLFKPGEYLVLTIDPDNVQQEYKMQNSQAFLKMTALPAFNNDAGAVLLLSDESRIDQFSYTEKMHFPLIKNPKGVSLERTSFQKPANEAGNFRSAAASAGFATPGLKNSQSVDETAAALNQIELLSETFSPDNDGYEDALHISYQFNEPGMVANVNIYNDRGILIKRLAKNTTLASSGTLIWDGLNDQEQRATMGIYIVSFDVFNLSGFTKKYKKVCVLASKLN